MAILRLHGPLKRLAAGRGVHELDAADVRGLLRELEREHGALAGWILNEQGDIRPHINVFVNGERSSEEAALRAEDEVEVLPAISGGCLAGGGSGRAQACGRLKPR